MIDGPTRDSERLELPEGLRGEVMAFQRMEVRQMSAGGMLIETGFSLHVDSLHEFRLALGERSVVVKGRIVHSHITAVDQDVVTYQTGIQFVEPSEPVARVINEFLEAIRKQ